MPRPALEVQQRSEQCIEWPSSVYNCNSGCYLGSRSSAFWARVSMTPAANRKRYFLSRKDDSVMLISACLNCLCSYSSRMMSAMQMEESMKRGTEGKQAASMYELKKRETFTEAISTAFTDTSFIQRTLQSHPIINYHCSPGNSQLCRNTPSSSFAFLAYPRHNQHPCSLFLMRRKGQS